MKISNPILTKLLKKYGWHEDRDAWDMVVKYKEVMDALFLDVAIPFVRSFGGLLIKRSLHIVPDFLVDDLRTLRKKVAGFTKSDVCPVAASHYMGQGDAALWIDLTGRFYVVDGEGMIYLGASVEEMLEVHFLHPNDAPSPPVDLQDSMARAWRWDE